MNENNESHQILTKEELRAITEGLLSSGKAVAVVSPFVSDQEILGRAFGCRGYEIIPSTDISMLHGIIFDEKLVAAVIAGELIEPGKDLVESLRRKRNDVLIYIVCDDIDKFARLVTPPGGVWNRRDLEESVSICLNESKWISADHCKTNHPGPRENPYLNTEDYNAFLESLLAPVHDLRRLLVRSIRHLKTMLGSNAIAGFIKYGEFSLEVISDTASMRLRAGRWILNRGSELWKEKKSKRYLADDFAAVDAIPLKRGDQFLGFLFLFWTEEIPAPDMSRIEKSLSGRIWEILANSDKGKYFLPWKELLDFAVKKKNQTFVIAAPVSEEKLELLLKQGDKWSREPGGAVLCLFSDKDEIETEIFLKGVLGSEVTAFITSSSSLEDPSLWVSSRSDSIAELRLAGQNGIYRSHT